MLTITGFTTEQTNFLLAFARSKGVEDLDLQDLVVKELSGKISIEMNNTPSLSFDQALENVYARYPITGFAVFLNDKQKEIRKYCRKKYHRSLLGFLMSKSIFLVFLIFGVTFTTAFLMNRWGIWMFFILVITLFYIANYRSRKKLVAPSGELSKLYFYRKLVMHYDDSLDLNTDYPVLHRLIIWSWVVFFPINIDLPITDLSRVFAALFSGLLLVFAYHTYAEMPRLINAEIKNRFSHLVQLQQ